MASNGFRMCPVAEGTLSSTILLDPAASLLHPGIAQQDGSFCTSQGINITACCCFPASSAMQPSARYYCACSLQYNAQLVVQRECCIFAFLLLTTSPHA